MPVRAARLAIAVLGSAGAAFGGARPVEFEFVAPENPAVANYYARELWAEVTTPSGRRLQLPAFYADGGLYAVRARPDEVGTFRFGAVSETTLGVRRADVPVSLVTPAEIRNEERERMPAIALDPSNPRQFAASDGSSFVPSGANLAWDPGEGGDTAAYYQRAFPAFARAHLNWMRVWMAHWDGMNLDWLPPRLGPSPRPGRLDEGVAETWDKVVCAAEDSGVYIQLVLQHHGQYTTKDNSDWSKNPWNAANPGGFLKAPEDFFTDPNARVITLLKYRTIVARWGWSPAILSWELFNEVHWTDAMRNGHEDSVARWHRQVAAFLRQVDVYGHLVTTSTDNVRSPINESMDYLQPHLYAADMVSGARGLDVPSQSLPRPVFYGEAGYEHQAIADEEKRAGTGIVPPVWASLFGQCAYPAEPWDGWSLLDRGRLGELGAAARFARSCGLATRQGLQPFSARVDCASTVPLRLCACQYWHRQPAPDFAFPLDGTDPVGESTVPYALAGEASDSRDGFPGEATYRINLAHRAGLRVRVDAVDAAGATLEASVDGAAVARKTWSGAAALPEGDILEVPVPAGSHALRLRSTGRGWVGITEIDFGMRVPALASIGKRGDRFIALWVYNRAGLYAVDPPPAVAGTIDLGVVSPGAWTVTWWDTTTGVAAAPRVLDHRGGRLLIPTPRVSRHAAAVLERSP
jgi:hypothetical protein